MDLRKLMLIDSDGKPSATLTAFFLGFLVVNFKLMVGGMTLFGIVFSSFTGGEYASCLTALGAIYVLRRNFTNKKEGTKNEDS